MEKDKDSVMWELCDGDINKASGRTAFDAMRKGDASGKAVVDEFINYLGCGLVNVINTFQPDILLHWRRDLQRRRNAAGTGTRLHRQRTVCDERQTEDESLPC